MRRLDKERLQFLEETSRTYEVALSESPEALSYLNGRGVSMASIDRYRLGLADDPPPEHKANAGRLSIPFIKAAGIVGFKFRCIKAGCIVDRSISPWAEVHEGHGKFMSPDPQALYNVAALDTDRGHIALAEGEPDTWILDGECDIPAVGIPSASGWKPHFKRLLKDFRTIWHFADPDDAGTALANQIQRALPQTITIHLPDVGGKTDVNRFFCARGRSAVRELVGLAA